VVNRDPQVTVGPTQALSLKATGRYVAGKAMAQIVTKQADSTARRRLGTRYIFGELVTPVLRDATGQLTFSPSLSFQLYAQPFTFSAITETSRSCARGRHSRSTVWAR